MMSLGICYSSHGHTAQPFHHCAYHKDPNALDLTALTPLNLLQVHSTTLSNKKWSSSMAIILSSSLLGV